MHENLAPLECNWHRLMEEGRLVYCRRGGGGGDGGCRRRRRRLPLSLVAAIE